MREEIYSQILAEKFKSNPDWNKIRKLQQLLDLKDERKETNSK